MRGSRHIVLGLMMIVGGLSPAGHLVAQGSDEGIIAQLTTETHEQAVACGKTGPACSVTPYELCASDGHYAARIATPFSRVASAVNDAKMAGRRPNAMNPGAASRWGVGIYVYPAENSASADAIQRLELRREGRTLQPTTSTVGPLTVKNSDGSTKQLARGFFAFSPEAFAPTADVTVVFVGSFGETTCLLDRARLRALR